MTYAVRMSSWSALATGLAACVENVTLPLCDRWVVPIREDMTFSKDVLPLPLDPIIAVSPAPGIWAETSLRMRLGGPAVSVFEPSVLTCFPGFHAMGLS